MVTQSCIFPRIPRNVGKNCYLHGIPFFGHTVLSIYCCQQGVKCLPFQEHVVYFEKKLQLGIMYRLLNTFFFRSFFCTDINLRKIAKWSTKHCTCQKLGILRAFWCPVQLSKVSATNFHLVPINAYLFSAFLQIPRNCGTLAWLQGCQLCNKSKVSETENSCVSTLLKLLVLVNKSILQKINYKATWLNAIYYALIVKTKKAPNSKRTGNIILQKWAVAIATTSRTLPASFQFIKFQLKYLTPRWLLVFLISRWDK